MINKKSQQKTTIIASILLSLFILLSLILVMQYLTKERQRDLMDWQSRLSLLAEIRVVEIEDYLQEKKSQIESLASNQTLKLFLSTHLDRRDEDAAILRAQQAHVRNLLIAETQNIIPDLKPANKINLPVENVYGIAVIDSQKNMLLSTRGFNSALEDLAPELDAVFIGSSVKMIDLHKASNGQAVYGYIVPVTHIQNNSAQKIVGAVLVLLNPEYGLYKSLENRQTATKTDETLLVSLKDESLTYVSPLKEKYEIFHQLSKADMQTASIQVIKGNEIKEGIRDYKGIEVLADSRKISGTPWVLVQKINANEALEESDSHQRLLLIIFTVLVLFLAASFVAIWRHSTSVRLERLKKEVESHAAILEAIAENIQDHLMLMNSQGEVLFMNSNFINALNLQQDYIGRKLESLLSKETRAALQEIDDKKALNVKKLEINGENRVYDISTVCLTKGEHADSKLYVLHDISELKQSQEKREQLAKGIITTLVKAVDLHDPYCAHHSERTREVVIEVAKEMGLSEEKIESLEMAALLANIGKLYIPKQILTKLDPLTDDEARELRRNVDYAIDILSELTFPGPVLEIISQKNEYLDGSGYPGGLSGDEILLESMILAVANAFVAMASSRAYREGRSVKEAVDILLQKTDSRYDRHVVAALFHIAENKADWQQWQAVK